MEDLFKILPQKMAILCSRDSGISEDPWIYEDLRLKWCSIEMDKEGISMESLRKAKHLLSTYRRSIITHLVFR